MAGIAGIQPLGGAEIDSGAAGGSLSFTGEEVVKESRDRSSYGVAVGHRSEDRLLPRLLRGDGVFILIDGEIVGVRGRAGLVRSTEAIAGLLPELFRDEGPAMVERLDGSFVLAVFEEDPLRLHLMTDRLGSRQLLYHIVDGRLAFSTRKETLDVLCRDDPLGINREGLAEVLAFGRTLETPLWEGVQSVPAGNVLTRDEGGISSKRYMRPTFPSSASSGDLEENAREVASALEGAVEKRVLGFGRPSLLLSGGLDSRTVLAFMPDGTTCYTVCDRRNLEVRIAARLAGAAGAEHRLLRRPPLHYLEIIPCAARVCEAAFDYEHAHLLGLTDQVVRPDETVMLSGYFIDTLVKGYNYPLRSVKVAGRRLALPLPAKDLHGERLSVSLMSKLCSLGGGAGALRVFGPEPGAGLREHLSGAVQCFIDSNSDRVSSPLDYFDLLSLEAACRHPHFPFISSLRQMMAERCVCFDNDLLDVAMTVPREQKFAGRLFRRVVELGGPPVTRTVNANTLLPASVPTALAAGAQTLVWAANAGRIAVMRRAGSKHPWAHTSHSWQEIEELWRSGPIGDRLSALLDDPAAMTDGLVHAESVLEMLSEHRSGRARWHQALSTVLGFLQWRSMSR